MRIALIANPDSGTGDAERVALAARERGGRGRDVPDRRGRACRRESAPSGSPSPAATARSAAPPRSRAAGRRAARGDRHRHRQRLRSPPRATRRRSKPPAPLAAGGTETEHVELARGLRAAVRQRHRGRPATGGGRGGARAEGAPRRARLPDRRRQASGSAPSRSTARSSSTASVIHDGLAWQVSVASSGAFGGGCEPRGRHPRRAARRRRDRARQPGPADQARLRAADRAASRASKGVVSARGGAIAMRGRPGREAQRRRRADPTPAISIPAASSGSPPNAPASS